MDGNRPPLIAKEKGFTLIEVVVALIIVALLASFAVMGLSGLKAQDSVDRAAAQVYDDLIYMRSRAITISLNYRVRWLSDREWVLEYYDTSLTTPAWVQSGDIRRMPTNTYLMAGSLANAGSNLEATSRGIYQFQNGKSGSPYITVEGLGISRTKSLYVDAGGAIEIRTP